MIKKVRSPCEEQDIKHVEERKMSSIRLNCFLRDKIKDTRQDFRQVNFDLYEVNFFQTNFSIVSSVNRQIAKEFLWIHKKKFPTLRIKILIERYPYRQENGEKGSIHVLIYPQVVLERDHSDTGLLLSESELPRRILPTYRFLN
ncbi:unnamed protein product [Rhizophagus irregularis]|uniref:Uncharacterized protein n=1 Tax=Rhizophagus irregularis TaxID=588596 RepID=A0A916EA51_9GLOM|nr:unnamed protein product [Rhizophagus irregularis]CAB5374540.1 unnamed protein product [Rhizophagus irregularis]